MVVHKHEYCTNSVRLTYSYTVRSRCSQTEFFTAFLPTSSIGPRLNYAVETVLTRVQIGVSVVAVVVKTEHLALTVVVTLCQCRKMDVKEEQCVMIKFCCKVDFSVTKAVELIQKAYSDAALSRTTIFEWHKRF